MGLGGGRSRADTSSTRGGCSRSGCRDGFEVLLLVVSSWTAFSSPLSYGEVTADRLAGWTTPSFSVGCRTGHQFNKPEGTIWHQHASGTLSPQTCPCRD